MNSRSFFFFIFDLNFGTLFDDTDSDGLTHVTDGETSKRSVGSESLNNHGLGRSTGYHASITVLDEGRVLLKGLTGTTIDLGVDVLELGGNMRSVTIENWAVTVSDLSRVSHDDDLG